MRVTTERRALDSLLAIFPWFDVLDIDWQHGPWLLVTLGQRSDDDAHAWATHKYAIWKRTGAVHLVGPDGAVIDPPIIEVR